MCSKGIGGRDGISFRNLEWLITLRTAVAFCNERVEDICRENLILSKQNLDEDESIDVEAYTMEELKEKIFLERLKILRRLLR